MGHGGEGREEESRLLHFLAGQEAGHGDLRQETPTERRAEAGAVC